MSDETPAPEDLEPWREELRRRRSSVAFYERNVVDAQVALVRAQNRVRELEATIFVKSVAARDA